MVPERALYDPPSEVATAVFDAFGVPGTVKGCLAERLGVCGAPTGGPGVAFWHPGQTYTMEN